MFQCLVRKPAAGGITYYIDGVDLLRLLQKIVNDVKTSVPGVEGPGTQANPWRITTADKWLGYALNLPKNTDNYLVVGGRLIKRGRDQYIGDEGPAWRSTSDVPGLLPEEPGLPAFGGVEPTYREAAQHVVDPNRVLPTATARRTVAGLAPVPTWKAASMQPLLAGAIRTFLKGEKLSLFQAGTFNRNYTRLQTALPVMAVAMFLAEPARNARAFPINLMLLDLAQRRVYGFDDIWWHPHALNVDKVQELNPDGTANPNWEGLQDIPGGAVKGPPSKEDRNVIDLQKKGQLHLVGGIMPSSPTGGGELAKREALPGKASGGKAPAFTADYIHYKEASVLVRWLEELSQGKWAAEQTPPVGGTPQALPYRSVVFPSQNPLGNKFKGAPEVNGELVRFEQMIHARTTSLNAMP